MNSEIAAEIYFFWKKDKKVARRKKRMPESREGRQTVPFGRGDARSPKKILLLLSSFNEEFGWDASLSSASIIVEWESIVGSQIYEKTKPVNVVDNVLNVECSSTAWATQLRRMSQQILQKIQDHYPDADLEDIRFYVEGVPTWRYGLRVVKGPGPRDTYK